MWAEHLARVGHTACKSGRRDGLQSHTAGTSSDDPPSACLAPRLVSNTSLMHKIAQNCDNVKRSSDGSRIAGDAALPYSRIWRTMKEGKQPRSAGATYRFERIKRCP